MTEITPHNYPGPLPPFARSIGNKTPQIAIVGEALGEQEDLVGAPFMGASGQELNKMLTEVGLRRGDCFLTNTFAFRPQANNLESLCGKRLEVGQTYLYPPISQGKYLLPQFLPELARLKQELLITKPNLVIALGNVACWALLSRTAISSIRGSISESTLIPGLKVLPTYHPAAVLRQWAYRPIVLTDLLKAGREKDFPDIRRPERWVLVNPTIPDIKEWWQDIPYSSRLAVDIETWRGQITMIGFAYNSKSALVIPFVDPTKPDYSYWNKEEELLAWQWVKFILSSPNEKIFQNGLYDLQYILKMGFKPKNCRQDTMLLHHSLFPELQKGLGFLGSIYTNESSWKLLRHTESHKKDE